MPKLSTLTKSISASGNAPIYGCRAWVNFNGTLNAAGSADSQNTNRLIRASGNVSSVLRNAAGNYTINFTVPLTDNNYCVTGTGDNSNAWTVSTSPSTFSLSSVTVVTGNPTTATNCSACCVAIFR